MEVAKPLFAMFNHDDLQAQVVPTLQRGLKRAPERGLDVASMMLSRCAVDLSRHVQSLVPDVIGPLTEDALLASATNLLTALAARCRFFF